MYGGDNEIYDKKRTYVEFREIVDGIYGPLMIPRGDYVFLFGVTA
jgi:hypothetical protein